jgi:integrase
LWDSDVKGFGVRCLPDGRASYLVKRRLGEGGRKAKVVWHVFGHSDTLAVGDAREAAKGHLLAIAAGTHLNTERRTKRTIRAFNDDNTLKAVTDQYIERHQANHSRRYWTEVQRVFAVEIIPALKPTRPIADITKREIIALIEKKEAQAPAVARFMFATLRPFFKWAVRRDLIASNPMDGLKPPPPPRARDRVLGVEEVATLWKALQPKPNPTDDERRSFSYPFGPFYKLLLLTAQRKDEVAGMRWEELNLAAGEWIIPKERTKNSKSHLVHLSPQAIKILQAIPRRNSPFVFTTTGATPIGGFSKAKERLDKITPSIAPWRVHDLRRTAASGMAAIGVQPFIVERILNHVSGVTGGLVGVYQRHEYYQERKNALADWATCIDAVSHRMLHNRLMWNDDDSTGTRC